MSARNYRTWTPADLDLVREQYGKTPTARLAAQLGRSIEQVRGAAKRLSICRKHRQRQPWTEADLAILRRDYGKRPAREICELLGRPIDGVYRAAFLHGLGGTIEPWTDEETETLRRLNADGYPDSHIARKLLRDRHAVSVRRKTLGLPSHEKGERWRKAISEGVRRQCERLGLSSPTELRAAAFRRFARESGWPEDLRPREVQILNVLADRGVPMTRLELSEAIGMRTDRLRWPRGKSKKPTLNLLTGNGPGGTYTASLMRRGFLLKIKRGTMTRDQGIGKSRDLYFLGPAALAILEEQACRKTTADSI